MSLASLSSQPPKQTNEEVIHSNSWPCILVAAEVAEAENDHQAALSHTAHAYWARSGALSDCSPLSSKTFLQAFWQIDVQQVRLLYLQPFQLLSLNPGHPKVGIDRLRHDLEERGNPLSAMSFLALACCNCEKANNTRQFLLHNHPSSL